MKKYYVFTIIALLLLLTLSSCALSIEEPPQDPVTTAAESEPSTYVSSVETTEAPTEISTEIPTEIPTEVSTELPTEAVTYEDEALNELVNQLRADGYDMEKTAFSEQHDSGNYAYSATLNTRILQPGDTLEVTLSDLFSYGEAVDAQEYFELNSLAVWLMDYGRKQTQPIYLSTEDGVRYTLTVGADTEPGAYFVEIYLADWMLTVCPIVIY